MMGEYLLYYKGRLFGGIYDNRLLLKPSEPALSLLEHPVYQLPYPGAKAMLLINEIDDADLLCRLVQVLYPVLPEPRKKSKTLP